MKNNGRSKALTRRGLAFLLAAVITMGYILPGGAHAVDETEPTVETLATEATDATQATETTQSTEATQAAEETKATEATEATQTTEATQAAEETKATEATETTQPTETQPQETVPETTAPTETQPAETQPGETTAPPETQPERTAYEQIMDIMTALGEEAYHLETAVEVLDEFTQRLRDTWNEAYDLNEEGKISDEELEVVDAKGNEILAFLKSEYGYENGVIETEDESSTGPVKNKVNGVAENVKINLFNYDASIDTNAPAVLRFRAQLADSNYYNRDVYYKSQSEAEAAGDKLHYDIVNSDKGNKVGTPTMRNVLVEGYPFVESVDNGVSEVGSGSLAYLFDPTVTATGKTYYPVTNDGSGTGLFQKDGSYYYYKSAYNHVEYVNGKLQLYDFALRPFGGRLDNRAQGHMLPFNTDVSQATQITDENGNWVKPTTAENAAFWESVNLWDTTNNKFAYDLNNLANNAEIAPNVWVLGNEYSAETAEEDLKNLPDYWYGMSVEFNFNVTKVDSNGRPIVSVVNGDEDMIFKFMGDYDVFVYIDDVLILDLGGGACDYGEINFTTGKSIEVPGGQASDRTEVDIETLFKSALGDNSYDYKTKFAQYTTHTLKFFYLERGTGTANNELRFNMEPMPSGNVNVSKSLHEDSIVTDYTKDNEYTFKLVEVLEDGSEQICANVDYVVGTSDNLQTNADGQFKIKAGQIASFTGLEPEEGGTKFRVYEVDDGVNADFSSVTYSGSDNGEVRTVNGVVCAEFTIWPNDQDNGIVHTIAFTNKLKTTDVTVTKNVTGNMGDRSKDFTFTAYLQYADGNGTAMKFPAPATGENYTVSEDGYTATFTLKHGESIKIDNIPLGATMVIKEAAYEDYATSANPAGSVTDTGYEVKFVEVTESNEVEFTNDKEVTIDTGIALDSLPYILILAGVAVVAVALVLHKRRKYED